MGSRWKVKISCTTKKGWTPVALGLKARSEWTRGVHHDYNGVLMIGEGCTNDVLSTTWPSLLKDEPHTTMFALGNVTAASCVVSVYYTNKQGSGALAVCVDGKCVFARLRDIPVGCFPFFRWFTGEV